MPRTNRQNLGDGILHVNARGNRRQKIFVDEHDYVMYLVLLERSVKRHLPFCHAYCLMPNHVHLVLEAANGALSCGMQQLNGTYARWFNNRHGVDGHLFDGRFRSWIIDNDEHWVEAPRYVVLNPVRAGLCANPSDWPWSSFAATVGTTPKPAFLSIDRLLAEFGHDERDAQRAYGEFVRQGIGACPGTGTGVDGGRPRPPAIAEAFRPPVAAGVSSA